MKNKFWGYAVIFMIATATEITIAKKLADECWEKTLDEKYSIAFPLCTKSAKQGDDYAQFSLGYMYQEGKIFVKRSGGTRQQRKMEIWQHNLTLL